MSSAISMIFIANAIILASFQQPDLPDDFKKPGGSPAAVEKQPDNTGPATPVHSPAAVASVSFSVPGQSRLVTHDVKQSVRYLVSEPWCPNCPQAKTRFLNSGGRPENIISMERAASLGHPVASVPAEFSLTETVQQLQPPSYRKAAKMEWSFDGIVRPSKTTILQHLRNGCPHQGKHWQAWHLESWDAQQLYALHDDDHNDRVPTFEQPVEAIVTGARGSPELLAEIIAAHLCDHFGDKTQAIAGSILTINVDVPEGARNWTADLLTRKHLSFGGDTLTVDWGGDRNLSLSDGRIRITPGATVTAKRYGVSVSTMLTGATYAPDLSSVTLELSHAPDLRITLK